MGSSDLLRGRKVPGAERWEAERLWQCVEKLVGVRHQMNTAGIASHCFGSPLTVRTQVKYKLCNPPNKRALNESAWMAGWELQRVRWKQECSWHLFNIIPQLLGAGRSCTEQNRFRPLNDKYLALFLCPTGFPGTGQGSVLTLNLPRICLHFQTGLTATKQKKIKMVGRLSPISGLKLVTPSMTERWCPTAKWQP